MGDGHVKLLTFASHDSGGGGVWHISRVLQELIASTNTVPFGQSPEIGLPTMHRKYSPQHWPGMPKRPSALGQTKSFMSTWQRFGACVVVDVVEVVG